MAAGRSAVGFLCAAGERAVEDVAAFDNPRLLAVCCLLAMWAMAVLGAWLRVRLKVGKEADKDELPLVVSATLTLLGLIIGFTFSMATARYDQRKLYEEEEANAIGTEYVRAELLPAAESKPVQSLLEHYLDSRIAYFESSGGKHLERADTASALLQTQVWEAIKPAAAATPTPVTALVVSGMNDLLNSQGYTQFAW